MARECENVRMQWERERERESFNIVFISTHKSLSTCKANLWHFCIFFLSFLTILSLSLTYLSLSRSFSFSFLTSNIFHILCHFNPFLSFSFPILFQSHVFPAFSFYLHHISLTLNDLLKYYFLNSPSFSPSPFSFSTNCNANVLACSLSFSFLRSSSLSLLFLLVTLAKCIQISVWFISQYLDQI